MFDWKRSCMLLILGLLLTSTTGCSSSVRSSSGAKTAASVPEPQILRDKVESIPSMDAHLTKLTFFGTGPSDIAPVKNPIYKNRFEHAAITTVHPEIHLEYPPPGRETLIGPSGFGVVVKGDSMAGRGIFDGDVVWVNPERAYAVGKVVLALVSDVGGELGMVVKTFARTEVGECLLSESAQGRSPVVCSEFKIIGPVVGITSWRLPN